MDLIFSSYGPYSIETENNFYLLQQKYPEIKRIHGLNNKAHILNLCCQMVDTEKFEVMFDQSIGESSNGIYFKKIEQEKNYTPDALLDSTALEVVYLTYKELQAEDNFTFLIKKWPFVKRLHGVRGLTRAFRLSSELVNSKYYVLIDGDNKIKEDFDITSVQLPQKPNTLTFYMTQNPVNDLVYGYGGIKVCPTSNFRQIEDNRTDPIASGGIEKIVPVRQVASVTEFNTSAFNAWKAGFREAVMLVSPDPEVKMSKEESRQKLEVWKTKGADRKYGRWAIAGAKAGQNYGERNFGLIEELKKINDPHWLEDVFNKMKGTAVEDSEDTTLAQEVF